MSKVSRRDFLRASAVAASGAVVAACRSTSKPRIVPTEAPTDTPIPPAVKPGVATPTQIPTSTPAPTPVEPREAPVLSAMVMEGKLPALDERLPQSALVIVMDWQRPGIYGGRFRTVHSQPDSLQQSMYGNSLIRWVDDGLGVDRGIAERWEHNEEKSEWTIRLRKGLKWSDGEPWTVDDIMYWWEDLVLNPEHSDTPPQESRSSLGTLAEFYKIDDYTLLLKFDAPAPMVVDRLATWVNGGIGPRWPAPRHYLEQFHPRYNKDYVGYKEHDDKMLFRQNPECPTCTSWDVVGYEPGKGATWGRNAYYYCVDADGNQLPYLDGVDETFVQDDEATKEAILAGQADFAWRQPFGLGDVAMLKATEAQSGLETRLIDSGSGTGSAFCFNQDYIEDNYRELFRTPAFQRALSHAWNREEARKILYFETGGLTSGTLSPKAIEYQFNDEAKRRYEEWRDAWKEYDPVKSMALLDSIDIVDTTGDGWRNFPDGSELIIRFDVPGGEGTQHRIKDELLAKAWNEIGIKTAISPIVPDRDELWRAGKLMSRSDREVSDGPSHLLNPQWLVPVDDAGWAPLQGRHYALRGTDKDGAELDVDPWKRQPPRITADPGGPIDQLWDLYDAARAEPATIARHELVWDMIKVHVDYGPFFMGCVANTPILFLVNVRMRNVPTRDDLVTGGFGISRIIPHPAVWNPEIFCWEDPENH